MPANASGVIYALGGAGGSVTLYIDKGHLVYLYNMMIIEQYIARSESPIPAGQHEIEVVPDIAGAGKGAVSTLCLANREEIR
ncbi:MAG TPA: hypothetical protein VIS96_10900 [Terrimicrobiaceae bacterium]